MFFSPIVFADPKDVRDLALTRSAAAAVAAGCCPITAAALHGALGPISASVATSPESDARYGARVCSPIVVVVVTIPSPGPAMYILGQYGGGWGWPGPMRLLIDRARPQVRYGPDQRRLQVPVQGAVLAALDRPDRLHTECRGMSSSSTSSSPLLLIGARLRSFSGGK